MIMQRIFFTLVALVMLSGCSKKIKETMGVVTPGPDEYKVQRGKALEIPPHYDLPTPGSVYEAQTSADSNFQNLNAGEQELIKEIEGK
jgi:hypothetical protein